MHPSIKGLFLVCYMTFVTINSHIAFIFYIFIKEKIKYLIHFASKSKIVDIYYKVLIMLQNI